MDRLTVNWQNIQYIRYYMLTIDWCFCVYIVINDTVFGTCTTYIWNSLVWKLWWSKRMYVPNYTIYLKNDSISLKTNCKTTDASDAHFKPLNLYSSKFLPPATLPYTQHVPPFHLDCKPPETPDKIFTYQSAGLFSRAHVTQVILCCCIYVNIPLSLHK